MINDILSSCGWSGKKCGGCGGKWKWHNSEKPDYEIHTWPNRVTFRVFKQQVYVNGAVRSKTRMVQIKSGTVNELENYLNTLT